MLLHRFAKRREGNLALKENSDEGTRRFVLSDVILDVPISLLKPPILRALEAGSYEAAEAAQLPYLIEDGDVILEIGAGLGFISTISAKDKRAAAVYAVEADPSLIPVIRHNHEINGVSVTLYNEMLGPEDGTHDFYISTHFWASSAKGTHGGSSVQVPMRSFQKRLAEIKPSLLIVDIEGGELSLFDNIDLSGVKKILLEVHQKVIGREGMKHLFDTLSAQGFHYDQWHSSKHIVTFSHVSR